MKTHLLQLLIFFNLFVFSLYAKDSYIENANDICYEQPTSSGVCLDMGICSGGLNCKHTYPLKNIGDSPLSNVKAFYDESGLEGSLGDNCGVTPSGTCTSKSNIDLGPIGILGKTSQFTLDNSIPAGDNSNAIWAKNIINGSCFNGTNLYATYTKNGINYRGKLQACPITIGFDKDKYQVSEDYSKADGLSTPLPVKIILSEAVPYDTSVRYTTRDGSAQAGKDYRYTTGRVTIPAGDTEKLIYIDIIHDPEIELDENFFIDLSAIDPNNGSVVMGINPTEVTILEQGAEDLPICYQDDFNSELDSKWRTLYSSGNFTPQIEGNKLRLTPGSRGIATAVTKDYEFISKHNMIVVEFEQYAYGGCGDDHGGLGKYGADGIVAVLYDSAVGASPKPGSYGGSMGYAQRTGGDGFEGGWLGLGIDEYGNFANCNEGRIGGLKGTSCDYDQGFNPQQHTNIASIRGDGAGRDGYEFLAASAPLDPHVAIKDSDTPQFGHKYRMTIDARDENHLYITLERNLNNANGYQVIINKFDAKKAEYNQNATPDYVRFALTAGTGGGCNNHEIDDLKVSGVCRPYNPNPVTPITSQADIVNHFIDAFTYNTGTKYITTKVANKVEQITGVHLNARGDASVFNSPDHLSFKIIPYLANSTCTDRKIILDENGHPAVISLSDGQTANAINIHIPKKAVQDARFNITALDFQKVYNNSGLSCLLNSSTTGNLQGIDQCVNSPHQYKLAFGEETYQRCVVNNGAPCSPSNNGRGDAPYNNDYGCLMCTLDTNSTCSSDNFAIRPDIFSLSTTDSTFPDLLKSANDINFTLKALPVSPMDNNDTVSGYNVINASHVLNLSTKLYTKDGTLANNGELEGTANWGTSTFNITNGISTKSSSSNDVVPISFDDVGLASIGIQDTTWAKVDLEDNRSTNDPSGSYFNNCDGSYICGEINATFIPDHFAFVDLNITNNNGNPGKFTYISNIDSSDPASLDMSARITTRIEARNKNDDVTRNFKFGTQNYENPLNIVLSIKDTKNGDANVTNISNTYLDFGKDNGDSFGTKTILWNENNKSKVLRFNFSRVVNKVLNPFKVTGNELNVTVSSTYHGSAPIGSITILDNHSGIMSAQGSATMLYGRTHTPRQKYIGTDGNALIFYEVYCGEKDINNNQCDKTLLPNQLNSKYTDDPRWFVNSIHQTIKDGKVNSINQKNHAVNSGSVRSITIDMATPTKAHLHYYDAQTKGYPYKATMETNASKWLIYNKYNQNAKKNEFEVEFINSSGAWAGERETNSTTKKNAANITNRRLMW